MLLVLLAVLAAAPIYWFLVPMRARKAYLTAASFCPLGLYDLRFPAVLIAVVLLLYAATHTIAKASATQSTWLCLLGFGLLTLFFSYNKLGASSDSLTVVATQSGIVFLGISYLVLKVAAMLVDVTRGSTAAPSLFSLASWLVFLPVYASGPIEEFEHFDRQEPAVDRAQILRGFERILIGCVKSLIFAYGVGDWTMPILHSPEGHSFFILLMAIYAYSFCIYLDFAGYSDIAIGLGAIHGYEIQENFNNPFMQRNLVAIWQNWHMSLTRWLRIYLFTPLSRAIMHRGGPRWDIWAIAAGQFWAFRFCGLWHGVRWEFAVWGVAHALGLIWINVGAREAGRHLPMEFVRWWRRSPVGHGMSCVLAVTYFSTINIFVMDFSASLPVLTQLFGLG